MRDIASRLLSNPPQTTCAPISPSEYRWPTVKDLRQTIAERLEDSPFRYFVDLRAAKVDLVTNLKVICCELVEMGAQSPIFDAEQDRISEILSDLNLFISHCKVHPHDGATYDMLSISVDEVQQTLSRLFARPSGRCADLANELDARLADFSQCAEDFFIYEVRKYAVIAYGNARGAPIPLQVHYSTLNSLTGNPEALIYDIDDCIVFSEHAHKECWGIAINMWASAQGFTARDREGVERLVRSVNYCLDKDRTSGLLQLLSDICQRRGFRFEVPPGNRSAKALEDALSPYRAEAMANFVRTGRVGFTPGAYDMLAHSFLDGKRIGFCTSTPREVSEAMLRQLFSGSQTDLDFDEVFPAHARIYGDTTPHRKPFPLGWLAAAQALGVRPGQAMIFDNSFNNCVGATDLTNCCNDARISAYGTDLLRQGEEFAGVIGITHGAARLAEWSAWAANRPHEPVKVVLFGMDRIDLNVPI